MDKNAIYRYLDVIERASARIKEILADEEMEELAPVAKPIARPAAPKKIAPVPPPVVEVVEDEARLARKKHIQALMAIDCWPEAVRPEAAQAAVTDEEQTSRANAVLDMLLMRSLDQSHFLDYGCGEGWIASQALDRGAKKVFGFDPKHSPVWKKFPKVEFTTDAATLPLGTFQTIFLYDVLDHCEDPVGVMEHVKTLMAPGGYVYVRCHPWTSKHASHLFKTGLNKSYIHLFLTWDELVELGHTPMFTRPEKNPVEAYRYWVSKFRIDKERFHREAVHEFFLVPAFKELLINEQLLEDDRRREFFEDMEIQFVDYVLR